LTIKTSHMKAQNIIHSHPIYSHFNTIKTYANTQQITEQMSWIELKVKPEKDVTIKLNDDNNTYLHFIYNLKDAVSLLPINTIKKKKLNKFQSAIMHDKQGFDTFLHLKANKDYEVCIVQLTKYNEKKEVSNLFLQFERSEERRVGKERTYERVHEQDMRK